MRKFLMATTALVALASQAFADAPTVSVGGTVDFEAGYVKQSNDYASSKVTANQKSVAFLNTTRLHIAASGKAENGVTYGANAKLNGDVSKRNTYSNGKVDRTYVWLESNAGRVELGTNFAASKLMQVGAETIARATGGASNGDWRLYPAVPTSLSFVSTGDSYLNSNDAGNQEAARKITWVSPRYSGFQFGLSYTPDVNNNPSFDTASTFGPSTATFSLKNHISVAANYTNTFANEVNLAVSASGDFAKSTISTYKDVKSYVVGAVVGKGEFSVAGSYGNDGKSYMDSSASSSYTDQKRHFFTGAVAYQNGPVGASLSYFNSKVKTVNTSSVTVNNKLQAVSLGVDYKLAPGFIPFAEATYFKYDTDKASVKSNKGSVVLLGTSVTF